MSEEQRYCSFCNRSEKEVEKLISNGHGINICNECIEACVEMLGPLGHQTFLLNTEELLKPKEIKEELDNYVIGQEHAKKVLSVAVYNHYKRIIHKDSSDDEVELQKSNVLLVGSTGSGKTLLAQTLAKVLHVPFAIADATTLTEAGYVGDDVENVLVRLLQVADYDVETAERGIIYIDEIDKIARKSENTSITRDVSGEGVQQSLLKIIEGTKAQVPPQGGRKHPNQPLVEIDTSNILFIVGGAFDGIEKLIKNRTNKKVLGFGATPTTKESNGENILTGIQSEDLVKYGLIPELIGRLPIITTLDRLDVEALVMILTKPRNSILKQYKKFFELENVQLNFHDEALQKVGELALERKVGARGLRTILESTILDLMYRIPSEEGITRVEIGPEAIENSEAAIIK